MEKIIHNKIVENKQKLKEVEKKLSKWEQFKVDYCGYLMMVILAAFGYIIFRIIRRARNNPT